MKIYLLVYRKLRNAHGVKFNKILSNYKIMYKQSAIGSKLT